MDVGTFRLRDQAPPRFSHRRNLRRTNAYPQRRIAWRFCTLFCAQAHREFFANCHGANARLGRRYGIGLQLINILRVPASTFGPGMLSSGEGIEAVGLDASQILILASTPSRVQPRLTKKWLAERNVASNRE